MSKSKNIKQNILESSGIPFNLIRFWNSLQRNYSGEGITVIEYAPTVQEGYFWRCFIEDKERGKGMQLFARNKIKVQDRINTDLANSFKNPDFSANRTFWNGVENRLLWRGCFMPVNELLVLSKSQLACHLTFLKFKQKYFPFVSFLSKLRNATLSPEQFKVPPSILGIWYHFIHYIDFLKEVAIKEEHDFKLVKELFKEHFSIAKFDQKLPSEQIKELLYLSLEQFYLTEKNSTKFSNYWKKHCQSFKIFLMIIKTL